MPRRLQRQNLSTGMYFVQERKNHFNFGGIFVYSCCPLCECECMNMLSPNYLALCAPTFVIVAGKHPSAQRRLRTLRLFTLKYISCLL